MTFSPRSPIVLPRSASRLNRRQFLSGAAKGAAITGLTGCNLLSRPQRPISTPPMADHPFKLGVASGEPLPDGVVLWTRLVPEPFAELSGMPDAAVEVQWRVANDEGMAEIVQEGVATAEPDWAHAVHVEVEGLEPDRWYWYQFSVGDEVSPTGRTRTAPAAGAPVDQFRFAFASCQRWDQGLYTAYRDMAEQDLDLIIHLGDYIYEQTHSGVFVRDETFPMGVMTEIRQLDDYRNRYTLYKLDPHLQEAHRLFPWMITWDDHEVYNNYFGEFDHDEPAVAPLLDRRTAAYQASYEHQPLRSDAIPDGPDMTIYRHRGFGDLLEISMLDTRQYRSAQGIDCGDEQRAAGDGFCADSLDPERTILGEEQKAWLFNQFNAIDARWSVIAQQVPMARISHSDDPDAPSFGGDMDKWDGYAAERDEVMAVLAEASQAREFNPVVVTGDVHANYVWDLRTDWDADSPESVVGTEFVGTSISSNGDGPAASGGEFTTVCGNHNGNHHNHLFSNHRGYVMCELDQELWTSTYRVMDTVLDDEGSARTLTSFVVEHGQPGAQQDMSCDPS